MVLKMRSGYLQDLRLIRREAWIVLGAAAAFGFSWTGVSDAILNLFLLRMGYGPQFVGASMAAAALGFAVGAVPAAAVSGRLGLRRGMIVGTVAWVGGMVALSLADLVPDLWRQPWVLATRLFAAGGLALHSVSSMPFLTGVTTVQERPHAFALLLSASPLGAFLGGLVGGMLPGLLAQYMGVSLGQPRPYGYALAAGLLVHIPALYALSTLPEWRRPTQLSKATVDRKSAPTVLLGVVALVSLLRVGGEYTARTFFNVYMDRALFVSAARIGAVMGLASLVTIPAPLAMPALVRRWGRVWTTLLGALGVTVATALLGFSAHWSVAAAAFMGMNALAAVARSAWNLLTQEAVGPEWRAMTAGVSNLASGLGVMLMTSVGGVMVVNLGYRWMFEAGAALVALGAAALWIYFRVPRGALVDRRGAAGTGSRL